MTSIFNVFHNRNLAYSYSTIEENLQCPICYDRFHDPRALPCQHIYCCSCLKEMIRSDIPYSIILCALCHRTFSYNNINEFPKSYIHNVLLDLTPMNCDVKGRCTKCQQRHVLNLCPCCDYYLCETCYNNDRQIALVNLENIFHLCCHDYSRLQMIPLVSKDNLFSNVSRLLNDRQTSKFSDIICAYKDLNFIYQQINQLHKQDPTNDDDDVIYIKTIQSRSTPNIYNS